MHDVTEGGISTALNEIANASKKGILVHKNKIPILKETQEICSKLKLDPLGLISSGALLITTSKNNSFKLIEKLKKEGFELKKIGHGGTLDPLAEGVLPIAIGKTTKLSFQKLHYLMIQTELE